MPIDTSVYYGMIKPINKSVNIIRVIRRTVMEVTGTDPYFNQLYRGKRFVMARQLFLYFVRKYTSLSQDETGQLIGKDHSTVVHAEKCVEKFRDTEKHYENICKKIDNELFKL
jgi:chromosomal replication initiation ATPase DnaA